MAFLKHFNRNAASAAETGLSANSNFSGGRFYNKGGMPNIEARGMPIFARFNIYHTLLSLPTWKFLCIILFFFIGINLLFASVYLLIGIEHLSGMVAVSEAEKFGEAFFFSAQTFTTVGYGRINPIGFAASFTAAVEAMVGLMAFALVTGLLYGRFAKPKAYIKYSQNILLVPYKEGVALMFRMVPFTKNYLVNVEVQLTVAMRIMENNVLKNKFFTLDLEINKAASLILNWTLVHVINEKSPLFGLSQQDIIDANTEVLVFVQGFDESFSSTVISRTSYLYSEWVYGAKFSPMYHPNNQNTGTVLLLDQLDSYELVPLPNDVSFAINSTSQETEELNN